MSYILDALRKAERQRRPAKIPTIETAPQAASAPRHRLWPWIGALVVLVNAAVLIWILRPVPTTPVVKSADRATAAPAPPAPAAVPGQAAPATPVEQAPRASLLENPAAVGAAPPQTAPASSQAPVSSRPQPQRKLAPPIERLEPKPGHAVALAPAGPKAETQKAKPPDGLAPPTSPPTLKAPAAAPPAVAPAAPRASCRGADSARPGSSVGRSAHDAERSAPAPSRVTTISSGADPPRA